MALTFTIGGTSFPEASPSTGRHALSFNATNKKYWRRRYHSPGQDGNFLVRGGQNGGEINVTVRYIGTIDEVWDLYNTDKAAWEDTEVIIADPTGFSYERCNLVESRDLRTKPTGRPLRECFMECAFSFVIDG